MRSACNHCRPATLSQNWLFSDKCGACVANILVRYLGEEGNQTPIQCAVSMANPFNLVRRCTLASKLITHVSFQLVIYLRHLLILPQVVSDNNFKIGFNRCVFIVWHNMLRSAQFVPGKSH